MRHLVVWAVNLEFHSNLVQTGAIWTSASGKLNWSLMRAVPPCPGNGRFFLQHYFQTTIINIIANWKSNLGICSQAVKYEMNIEYDFIWIWIEFVLRTLYSLKVKASFDVFMKSGAWSHTWYLSILGDHRII